MSRPTSFQPPSRLVRLSVQSVKIKRICPVGRTDTKERESHAARRNTDGTVSQIMVFDPRHRDHRRAAHNPRIPAYRRIVSNRQACVVLPVLMWGFLRHTQGGSAAIIFGAMSHGPQPLVSRSTSTSVTKAYQIPFICTEMPGCFMLCLTI
jgi:hypothetical protein